MIGSILMNQTLSFYKVIFCICSSLGSRDSFLLQLLPTLIKSYVDREEGFMKYNVMCDVDLSRALLIR